MNEYDEIDLIDLMFYCLKKWRWIVAVMLLFAVCMGVSKYPATVNENREKQKLILEEKLEAEKAEKEANTEEEETEPIVLENPMTSAVKASALGLVIGAFLMLVLLVMRYLMGGRLQNVKNFKHDFGIPLLGIVSMPVNTKKWFGFVDAWILRWERGPYAKISYEEQIQIAASNVQNAISKESGLKKIMLAGTLEEKDTEEICQKLKNEIEDIYFSKYKQVAFQASALEELRNYDGVLFIEKKEKSYIKYLILEKRLVDDREVGILGAVVF